MEEFKIDKDVPYPEQSTRATKYPIKVMKVGDSFVAGEAHRNAIQSSARYWGVKVSARKIDDKNIRVWRIK